MALYTPRSIFHLARLLYVRPETFGPYLVSAADRCLLLGPGGSPLLSVDLPCWTFISCSGEWQSPSPGLVCSYLLNPIFLVGFRTVTENHYTESYI